MSQVIRKIQSIDLQSLLSNLDKIATPSQLANRIERPSSLEDHEFQFFQIESLTHFSNEPQRQALENVYSSFRYPGINLVYLLKGDSKGVKLFLGVVRNKFIRQPSELSVAHAAKAILQPSFHGNFRGSELSVLDTQGKQHQLLTQYPCVGLLQGAVGNQEQGENNFFQGIDRLIDIMLGKEYCLVVNAEAINLETLQKLEQTIHHAYIQLAMQAKLSVQHGQNSNTTESKGRNSTYTEGNNTNTSTTVTDGSNSGTNDGWNKSTSKTTTDDDVSDGSSEGRSGGTSSGTSYSKGETNGSGTNESQAWGSNENTTAASGDSLNISTEIHDKKAQQWLNYIDETLLPRIDYARSRGGFNTCISLFTKSEDTLHTLGSAAVALFSGNQGNNYPLKYYSVSQHEQLCYSLHQFQIPQRQIKSSADKATQIVHALKSRLLGHNALSLGSFYSPKELSLVAGLPQKEVTGLALHEEVSFGLNPPTVKQGNQLPLGQLVQDGRALAQVEIALDRQELNKHLFVGGVTGSGKTTTCQHLLRQSQLPFLVIEPAKTEYRALLNEYDDLVIFTPGRDDLGAFRLNPLELQPNESISARVDVVKASFVASFEMEAAIPQILESALYRCYEKLGWDLNTSTHPLYTNPFASECYPFPLFQDLLITTTEIVSEQGFDQRLKDDYIGSIKARLQGLLVGAKKQIFNNLRSLDFSKLLHKRVIIELEEIRNGAEKSLIMAFIMTNLVQALKNEHRQNPAFRHLTLIEEAHRLLSNPTMGESHNRRQAVEMFADMLAEIRKYGEGLIIVDQIPNKLSPEVLKSTNTKIIHKLFAQDDKEAIGNTMDLNKKQMAYLSRLNVGQTLVFSQGWQKAVQVQITPTALTSDDLPLAQAEPLIKRRVQQCYLEQKQMLIAPTDWASSINKCHQYLDFTRSSNVLSIFTKYLDDHSNETAKKSIYNVLQEMLKQFDLPFIGFFLTRQLYIASTGESLENWQDKVNQLLHEILQEQYADPYKNNLNTKNYRRFY